MAVSVIQTRGLAQHLLLQAPPSYWAWAGRQTFDLVLFFVHFLTQTQCLRPLGFFALLNVLWMFLWRGHLSSTTLQWRKKFCNIFATNSSGRVCLVLQLPGLFRKLQLLPSKLSWWLIRWRKRKLWKFEMMAYLRITSMHFKTCYLP